MFSLVIGVTATVDPTAKPVAKRTLFNSDTPSATSIPVASSCSSAASSSMDTASPQIMNEVVALVAPTIVTSGAQLTPSVNIVKAVKRLQSKVESRAEKNRKMFKAAGSADAGNSTRSTEAVNSKNKLILKGVRSNRRFDLQMKFRNEMDDKCD